MVASPLHHLCVTTILLSVSLAFQPSIFLNRQRQHQHINASTLLPLDASPSKTPENEATSHSSNTKRRRRKSHSGKKRRKSQQQIKNPNELETWRIYGVDVNPDNLGPIILDKRRRTDNNSDALPSERAYLTPAVLSSLLSRLRIEPDTVEKAIVVDTKIPLPPQLRDARVVRRSVDARRRRGADPKYTYVIDITTTREVAVKELKLVHQPGRVERMNSVDEDSAAKEVMPSNEEEEENESKYKPKIIIGENLLPIYELYCIPTA